MAADNSSLQKSALNFFDAVPSLLSSIAGESNNIKLSGSAPGVPVTLSGVQVPVNPDDAANKQYVDNRVNGLSWINSVRLASATARDLNLMIPGGVPSPYTIDGIMIAINDRVLLKNQSVPTENGVYVIGAIAPPERVSDMASGTQAASKAMFVDEGITNKDTAFVCSTDPPTDVVGADPLAFVKFSSMVNLQPGSAIMFDGANSEDISVKVGVSGGLEVTAGPANALQIAAAAVTNAMLVNNAITVTTGDGLQGGGSGTLGGATAAVTVDATVLRTTGDWAPSGEFNFTSATNASVGVGAIRTAGGIYAAQDGIFGGTMQALSFNSVSDERKKEMIAPIDLQHARQCVRGLNPVTWKWRQNEAKFDPGMVSGFIAQEVEVRIPEAVQHDIDDNLTLNYRTLWTNLLASHLLLLQEHAQLKEAVEAIQQKMRD
jgi:hypothetical protein